MAMSQKDWKQTNSRNQSRFSHLDWHLDRSCCNSCPQKVTNKEYENIGLFVQSLYNLSWTLNSYFFSCLDWRPVTEKSQLNAWARAGKQIKLICFCSFAFLFGHNYNKHLINWARSVCMGESWPQSLVTTGNLGQDSPIQTSRSVNKSLVHYTSNKKLHIQREMHMWWTPHMKKLQLQHNVLHPPLVSGQLP